MGYPAGYPGRCSSCGTQRDVSDTYQAALCPRCDEWQSPTCRGLCSDCSARPPRPSLAADLALVPQEVAAEYDLDTSDDAEMLRRVALPVLHGTLPAGVLKQVEVTRTQGDRKHRHWPPDLRVPDFVWCRVTLSNGETWDLYLADEGRVDPEQVAERLAEQVQDGWCESSLGWGQQVRATYEVPPAR